MTCIDVRNRRPLPMKSRTSKRWAASCLAGDDREIIDGGLITADGTFISGDMVITIGESPDLGYLPEGVRKFRDWVIPGADMSLLENVFAAGDVIKPGLLADAIGTGIKAAEAVDASLHGVAYAPVEKKPVPSGQLSTAYFTRCPHGELPAANRDFDRCVSCGTCRDCRMCLESCPEGAISRETLAGGAYRYVSDPDRCIGCGICSGVCPCGIWTMHPNVPLE
ncbi:MAG: 4Fe-4S dicluster domain-containing protein [Bilophila wadsworthia]